MSQETTSLKIKRTCDGCGAVKEYETVGMQPTDPQFAEMQGWFTIIREVLDPESGRFVKLMVQACKSACASLAAVKLESLPETPADDIDLDSLRTPRVN